MIIFDLQGFVKHAVLPASSRTSEFEIVEIELQQLHYYAGLPQTLLGVQK